MQDKLIDDKIYRVTYRVKLGKDQVCFVGEKVINSPFPIDEIDFKKLLTELLGHWGKISVDEILFIDNITP